MLERAGNWVTEVEPCIWKEHELKKYLLNEWMCVYFILWKWTVDGPWPHTSVSGCMFSEMFMLVLCSVPSFFCLQWLPYKGWKWLVCFSGVISGGASHLWNTILWIWGELIHYELYSLEMLEKEKKKKIIWRTVESPSIWDRIPEITNNENKIDYFFPTVIP